MFSLGKTVALHVTKAELVREIYTSTSLNLGKPSYQTETLEFLLGRGVITSSGPYWAQQRKVIAPELYKDKVKVIILIIQFNPFLFLMYEKKKYNCLI